MLLNPYLNFDGNAKEALQFYQSVFGGELIIQKMEELPGMEISEDEKNRILHISLPLENGQQLMASDYLCNKGHIINQGNNNYISITADSRDQADRLYAGLSEGGNIEMPMDDMFWGDYFGSFKDKFGVFWMINYKTKNET